MAFQDNMAMQGNGFGPASRSRERSSEPFPTLGSIKEGAMNMASRILRSVETWMSGGQGPDDVLSDMSMPFGARGLASSAEAPSFGAAPAVSSGLPGAGDETFPSETVLQPSPLQVGGGSTSGLRLAGAPRGLPFRHPTESPRDALTARPVRVEPQQGLPMLRPLDEVLAKYLQDRDGGSEGMHVFDFDARERLNFEARIGRDLARLAGSSSRGSKSSVFDQVTSAPRPAMDTWSQSAPPRGFSLGGVIAPVELPAAEPTAKRRRVNAAPRRVAVPAASKAEESDDVVEVAESVPPVESDVEVVEPASARSKPAAKAATKQRPKGPKADSAEDATKSGAVEAGEEITKVTTDEDFWRVQIEAIYRRRNPHKLSDVPGMMEKHKGKELLLYKKVCQRYDLDSSKLYADPKSWESEDKDVKDDDDDVAPVSSSPPTLGFAASASTAGSIFGTGGASIFGAASSSASSGSSLLFDIPPPPSDPDKKINIFASSTQAEKRFATADAGGGSGGSLFGSDAAPSGGLFGTGGAVSVPSLFGDTGGSSLFTSGAAKADETPKKSKAETPAFPPAPLFGADKADETPKKSKAETPAFPPAPLFGADKADETSKKSKAETPAFPPAPLFGISETSTASSSSNLFAGSKGTGDATTSLFGMPSSSGAASGPSTTGSIFGGAVSSGVSLFGSSGSGSGTSMFGSSSGSNMFASTGSNIFASGTGGASSSSLFASAPAFGETKSASGSLFGTPSAGPELIPDEPPKAKKETMADRVKAASAPAFPPAMPTFGGSSEEAPAADAAPTFASSSTALFGGSTGSIFGVPSSSAESGAASTTGSIFATSSSSGGNLFGGSESSGATSLFGAGSGSNMFAGSGTGAGFAPSSGSIFGPSVPNIFASKSTSSGSSLFGASSGSSFGAASAGASSPSPPAASPVVGGFGRQISALSEPFGLAPESTSKRRAAEEDDAPDADAPTFGGRRKADPEVLAKRKIVRGRRSSLSGVKRSEEPSEPAVTAEFPPKPPTGSLFGAVPEPGPAVAKPKPATPPEKSEAAESNPFAGLTSKPAAATAPAAPAATAAPAAAPAAATPAAATETAGEEKSEGPPVKVETKEDFWRVQIEAIYRRRNPMKLNDVPSLMEKHKGKEVILFRKVCQRYDLDPKKIYTNDDAWEGEDKEFKDDPDDAGAQGSSSASATPAAPAPLATMPSIFDKPAEGASSGASIFGSSVGNIFGTSSSSSGTGSALFGAASSGSIFGAAGGGSGSIFGGSSSSGSSIFAFGGGSDTSSASEIFKGGNVFAGGGGGASLFGTGSGSGAGTSGGFGASTGSIFGAATSGGNIFGGGSSVKVMTGADAAALFGGGGGGSSVKVMTGADAAALFGGGGGGNIFTFGGGASPGAESNKKKRRAE